MLVDPLDLFERKPNHMARNFGRTKENTEDTFTDSDAELRSKKLGVMHNVKLEVIVSASRIHIHLDVSARRQGRKRDLAFVLIGGGGPP